jgi:hypothetical protein
MPIIKLTSGDDNPVLINSDHIIVVRQHDDAGSEYCEVEMSNTDAVAVNETIAEIEAIIKSAS